MRVKSWDEMAREIQKREARATPLTKAEIEALQRDVLRFLGKAGGK